MNIWDFIVKRLDTSLVTLLYVLESNGSSPGRKGFTMAVDQSGNFKGTIGGGIMEVKMIELAKARMKDGTLQPIVKKQFHDKEHSRNQSGLICSGDQTVALIVLNNDNRTVIEILGQLTTAQFIRINPHHGIRTAPHATEEKLELSSETDFDIIIKIPGPSTAHIFGAGHVGRALARQLSILDYRIIQYDNRPDLPGLKDFPFADEIKIINYQEIKNHINISSEDVVFLVSYSYRDDKILLQQLYDKSFAYLGMMGSDHKIATLRQELKEEGITEQELAHIYMPIGLPIFSRTAAEIAVSIVAELIKFKNKELPTGRGSQYNSTPNN